MITLDFNESLAPEENRISSRILEMIQQELESEIKDLPNGTIGVSYVSDVEIRRLNRIYRKKDSVTDVLSFSYLEDRGEKENIGDIVISFDQAKRQAQDGDVELELVDLLVHGILHVVGFDHEKPEGSKEMFSIQDRIIAHIL